MKKLTKTEYEILYYISRGRNSIERLGDLFENQEILDSLYSLEKLGLMKISHRDNEIYGFMETSKGNDILKSSEYSAVDELSLIKQAHLHLKQILFQTINKP